MKRQTIDVRATSGYWLEKIDEILARYQSKLAWDSFIATKEGIRKAVAQVELPSISTLADIFTIIKCCQEAIRDAAYDKAHVDNDILRNVKGKDGKPQEIFFQIRYGEEVAVELPNGADEEDGTEQEEDPAQ